MPVQFMHAGVLPPFAHQKGDDARVFLHKYERLNGMADDRMKVENFAQYLDGAAADWFYVLQNSMKARFVLDEYGV